MRDIIDHKINGLNEAIDIRVCDDPGPGGACHIYQIVARNAVGGTLITSIRFQKGPIQEAGVNGISNEALLAILIDRLRSFQSGPFACPENGVALTRCNMALASLLARTIDRSRRGVEGTSKK